MEAHEALTRHEHVAGGHDGEVSGLARQAALLVAVIAAFLAFATFMADRASNHVITGETRAADTSARLQANETKATIAEADENLLKAIGAATPAQKVAVARAEAVQERITAALAPIDRELAHEVDVHHAERDHAEDQHLFLGLSEVSLQIGIVLAGIAILARRRWLLGAGGVAATVGVVFLVVGLLT